MPSILQSLVAFFISRKWVVYFGFDKRWPRICTKYSIFLSFFRGEPLTPSSVPESDYYIYESWMFCNPRNRILIYNYPDSSAERHTGKDNWHIKVGWHHNRWRFVLLFCSYDKIGYMFWYDFRLPFGRLPWFWSAWHQNRNAVCRLWCTSIVPIVPGASVV